MIVYIAARLIAWLYGYAWPLEGKVKNTACGLSIIEFAVVAILVVVYGIVEAPYIIQKALKGRGRK